jgi:hypothetical protein
MSEGVLPVNAIFAVLGPQYRTTKIKRSLKKSRPKSSKISAIRLETVVLYQIRHMAVVYTTMV